MAYEVNYDDQRFKDVEADKTEALSELENTYSDMVNNSDKYYQAQVDASKQWEKTQTANQQAQTDFAIEQIEQQKEQAEKDYKKEQSGAYKDWKVESNRYGANAETMAAQGLTNTGYGESSQVAMYNTYQNRVAQARESYNVAVMNYNNAIKDARLQNNSVLAEIAYQALQTQLELSLAGFQYKNQLILDKTNKRLEVDQMYYSRYQDVLNQINHENQFQFQIDQYNEQLAMKKAAAATSGSKTNKKTGEKKIKDNTGLIIDDGKTPVQKTVKGDDKYNAAINLLSTIGATNDGLLTPDEWNKKKKTVTTTGVTPETAYSTYEEYVDAFVDYETDRRKLDGALPGWDWLK